MARLNRGLLPGPSSSINFGLCAVLHDTLYGSLPFLQHFPPFWCSLLQILQLTNSKVLVNLTGMQTCHLEMYWLTYITTSSITGPYASGCNSLNGQGILSKTFWHSVIWQMLIYIVTHFSKDTLQSMNYTKLFLPQQIGFICITNSIVSQFVSSERLSLTVLGVFCKVQQHSFFTFFFNTQGHLSDRFFYHS